jgi:hypothetical protein
MHEHFSVDDIQDPVFSHDDVKASNGLVQVVVAFCSTPGKLNLKLFYKVL